MYLGNKELSPLELYIENIKKWSKRTTIVSKKIDEDRLFGLLFDSLVILNDVKGEKVADLGSGAGFPGIPLAIVRKDLHVTLVEVVRKKCIFLDYVAGVLGLKNTSVFCNSWDKLKPGFDTVVSMGTGFDEIKSVAKRVLREDGRMIYVTTKLKRCSRKVKNPFIDLPTCIIVSRETDLD